MTIKTYQFRLYPNMNQSVVMTSALNDCRHLYNEMLEDRKGAYDRCGVGLNYNQQAGWRWLHEQPR